jgi:Abortive infection alpha
MGAPEEFAEELAKNLPVKEIYRDAAAPAAKQTGQLLEDLVKVVQLALAPVQYLGALQDRYRDFLNSAVHRVPEHRRVAPAPQILGPVLEGVRYEPQGTSIDEMFSQLLSRSMDADHVSEAHPAYPLIIRQLSSDEAKIFALLNGREYDYVVTKPLDRATMLFGSPTVEVDDLPREDLIFPGNVMFYLEHLDHLGLAKILRGNQEPIHGDTARVPGGPLPLGRQTGVTIRCQYTLTDFGRRFVTACLGEKRKVE